MTTAPRLSNRTLASLPAGIMRPAYDRAQMKTGIVHLGIGAFHRAHQAVMTEAVLNSGDLRWGILAASLRSPETRDKLEPQDGLYALAVRDGASETLQVIGAIRQILVAPENPEVLIAAMADPDVRIVSLTVTEKGYCHLPATGTLDENHPDIQHDLANPDHPRSAPGYLVAALARRLAAGIAPFTVLCCDNLPSNGRTVHRVITRLAELRDPALGAHVARHVACPCTMVDRIVPATTDESRATISEALGADDRWPVVTEPFSQWVIEDHFPLGRPAWEMAGAEFARDVAPFELMKLRMLNGAHSCLAYLGSLAGHEMVADAAVDPVFERFIEGYWAEIIPTLPPPPGTALSDYAAALLRRFRNPTIRHRLWQIAMDGSQKIPQRWLGPIRERRQRGQSIRHLLVGLAGWARYVSGTDEAGNAIDLRDPHADALRGLMAGCSAEPEAAMRRLVAFRPVFGDDLAADSGFVEAAAATFARLMRDGARAVAAAP